MRMEQRELVTTLNGEVMVGVIANYNIANGSGQKQLLLRQLGNSQFLDGEDEVISVTQ